MTILHVIDDEKFIGFCNTTFDIKNNKNMYLKSRELSLEFLSLNKINVIFIHFLREEEIVFLSKNDIDIPVVWMFWGADGFSLPNFYNYFLDKQAREFLFEIKRSAGFIPLIKHLVKINFKTILNYLPSNKTKLDVISKFSFIVPIVPGDYDLISKEYGITVPPFHFNYILALNSIAKKKRNNILLGNSSSITNNHISIFSKLSKLNLENSKVYVPLNYGNVEYKNQLINYIDKKNNQNIIPIVDFLSYSEYSDIINSCSIMIMNHHRQQALGNIVIGLTSGCTIYMNTKSSLYDYLISNGFIIKNVDNLEKLIEISYEDKIHNFELAKDIFGEKRQKQLVSELLKTISNMDVSYRS